MKIRHLQLFVLVFVPVVVVNGQGFDFSNDPPEDLTKYDNGFDFSDVQPEDLTKYDKELDARASKGKIKISAKNFGFYFTDELYKRRERIYQLIARLDYETVRTFNPIEQICREIEADRTFMNDDDWEFVGSSPKEISELKEKYRAFHTYLHTTRINDYLVALLRAFKTTNFTRDILTLDRVRDFIKDSGAHNTLQDLENFTKGNLRRVRTRKRYMPFPADDRKAREIFVSQVASSLVRITSPLTADPAVVNRLRSLDEWLEEVTNKKLETMMANRDSMERLQKKALEALLAAGDKVAKLPGSPTVVKLFELDKKILDVAQVQIYDQKERIKQFKSKSDEMGQILDPSTKYPNFIEETFEVKKDIKQYGPQYQERLLCLMKQLEGIFRICPREKK